MDDFKFGPGVNARTGHSRSYRNVPKTRNQVTVRKLRYLRGLCSAQWEQVRSATTFNPDPNPTNFSSRCRLAPCALKVSTLPVSRSGGILSTHGFANASNSNIDVLHKDERLPHITASEPHTRQYIGLGLVWTQQQFIAFTGHARVDLTRLGWRQCGWVSKIFLKHSSINTTRRL